MLLNPIDEIVTSRRILFVGGKGGVGKTTVAAALAATAAERGRKTLVVSTDPAHSLGDVFGVAIGSDGRRLGANLRALEIDPEVEADAHITDVKGRLKELVHPRMYGEVERQLDFARLAPGTVEAALLERIADLMVDGDPRLLIFDTAPTGHTLRLLSLPEIMGAWTDGLLRHQARSSKLGAMLGRLGRGRVQGDELSLVDTPSDFEEGSRAARLNEVLQARRRKLLKARELLVDTRATGFLLVLNPDRLSILESEKALRSLGRAGLTIAAAVVNRVLPADAEGEFLAARRRQETAYLAEIERVFASVPRVGIPLQTEDIHGLDALLRFGQRLTA